MTSVDARQLFELGLGYLDQGLPDQAESAFRKALALDPKHAKANVNLGMLLQFAGKGDFDNSSSDYQRRRSGRGRAGKESCTPWRQ